MLKENAEAQASASFLFPFFFFFLGYQDHSDAGLQQAGSSQAEYGMCWEIFRANWAFSQSTALPLTSKEQNQTETTIFVQAQIFPFPKILDAICGRAYIKYLLWTETTYEIQQAGPFWTS